MCDQQKIGFFISRLTDPKSLQLTASFFMFDQMFKSTRPKNGFGPIELLFSAKRLVPKNIHSWGFTPKLAINLGDKNSSCPSSTQAMYQTFTNERLPPGPGGALAVQCQKPLGEVSRSIGWRMGLPPLRVGFMMFHGVCGRWFW